MKGSAVRVRASAPYEMPAKPRLSVGLCLAAKAYEPGGGNAGGNKHARGLCAGLVVVPEDVGSSGSPWRLRAAKQLSPKEDPDEASR
jgi:hypothetical protein